jgi:hypothetical protein
MQQINQEVKGTKMHNLHAFNTTYLIITQAVTKKLGTRYFSDDALMETFDCNFAEYYFTAYEKYQSKVEIAPAWQSHFDQVKSKFGLQIKNMALGVNAHVNNDLPQTLYDTLKDLPAEKVAAYKEDFTKINEVIADQLPLVIQSLQENKIIGYLQNNTLNTYRWLLKLIIVQWRTNAWRNFEQLQKSTITKAKIEKDAKNQAHILETYLP